MSMEPLAGLGHVRALVTSSLQSWHITRTDVLSCSSMLSARVLFVTVTLSARVRFVPVLLTPEFHEQ